VRRLRPARKSLRFDESRSDNETPENLTRTSRPKKTNQTAQTG
jgi:hypothetical protein